MDKMIVNTSTTDIMPNQPVELSPENRLEIIDEGVRKKYLARLSEMQ